MVIGQRLGLLMELVSHGHDTRLVMSSSADRQRLKAKFIVGRAPDVVAELPRKKMATIVDMLRELVDQCVVNDHGHSHSNGRHRVDLFFAMKEKLPDPEEEKEQKDDAKENVDDDEQDARPEIAADAQAGERQPCQPSLEEAIESAEPPAGLNPDAPCYVPGVRTGAVEPDEDIAEDTEKKSEDSEEGEVLPPPPPHWQQRQQRTRPALDSGWLVTVTEAKKRNQQRQQTQWKATKDRAEAEPGYLLSQERQTALDREMKQDAREENRGAA